MLQAIFELLFEFTCAVSGEVILWIVTLGRRTPFEIKNSWELSALVGVLFWALITIVVAIVFIL